MSIGQGNGQGNALGQQAAPAAYAPVSPPPTGVAPQQAMLQQLVDNGSQPPPAAAPAPAPMPVSAPNGGFPTPQPLSPMSASAIQVGGGNPFALGGRTYGNYVPPNAPQAPTGGLPPGAAPMAPPRLAPRMGTGTPLGNALRARSQ